MALAVTLPLPLYQYGRDRFDRVTDRSIEEQLLPMLQGNERPLASELKEQAWSVMEPLVTLDEAEREYVDRFCQLDVAKAKLIGRRSHDPVSLGASHLLPRCERAAT